MLFLLKTMHQILFIWNDNTFLIDQRLFYQLQSQTGFGKRPLPERDSLGSKYNISDL